MKTTVKNNFVVFFITACFTILVISILYLSKQTNEKFDTVLSCKKAKKKLDLVLSACYEMEATARGLIITKDSSVASTFSDAKQLLINSFKDYQSFILQTKLYDSIEIDKTEKLIIKKLDNESIQIRLVDTNQEKLQRGLKYYITKGDIIMDSIRDDIAFRKENLEQKIDIEEASLTSLQNKAIIFIILLALFACIVVIAVFYTIKNQIKQNNILHQENMKQNELLEQAESIAKSGSWSWNINTNEVKCSKGVYKIFGLDYNTDYIDFDYFGKVFHPDEVDNITKELEYHVSNNLPYSIEQKLKLENGTEKITLSRGKPKEIDGDLFYFGSILDITDQKKQEVEISLRNEELEILNENLSQFAYIASHDLQEPLRKIRMFTTLLVDEYESKEPNPYIDRIQHAAQRMQQLIKDLLHYSRISRNTENELSKVNLNETINSVQDDLSILIEEKNASISVLEFKHDIIANKTQIHQLFQNLISNAIKFSKQHITPEIKVTYKLLKKKEIKYQFESNFTNFIEILVEDNGIGFSTEYKEQIFTVFQRLHGRKEYKGTGIGLAICRKICQNHGGAIIADSMLDKGSTFYIYLPTNLK